jgi:hypothetical protein
VIVFPVVVAAKVIVHATRAALNDPPLGKVIFPNIDSEEPPPPKTSA